MSNKSSEMKVRMPLLKLSILGVVATLMVGHQMMTNAEEHHEQHQQKAVVEEHHDHHEHHKAAAEAKGYVSMLSSYSIPKVKMTDSDGIEGLLSEAVSSDEPVMLNFIFTTCTAICPPMSATFAQVAQQMDTEGEVMQLISISVDPEYDTPGKLKEYAKQFEAGPQWKLFTGSAGNSILVQRAFDAYRGDKMNHLPLTFIRGPNSTQWTRIEGLASAGDLIQEYRSLLAQ